MSRFERAVFATSGCLDEETPALPGLIEEMRIKNS
jgi:hypothetical protein